MESRDFPVAVVISAYTGIFLCETLDLLYSVATYVAHRPLFHHEQPAARDKVEAHMLACAPFLAEVSVDDIQSAIMTARKAHADKEVFLDLLRVWNEDMEERYGKTVTLTPLPEDMRLEMEEAIELSTQRFNERVPIFTFPILPNN